MNSPTWADDDDQLMDVVKDTLTDNDVVMDRMREAALAAFTWRTIDLELEQLTLAFDSAFDQDLAVRGTTGEASRMLTFTGPTVGLELEIDDDTIIGQLIPAESGLVTLLLVPVQALLILAAMSGFRQAWNVEVERRPESTTRAAPQPG